LANEVEKFLEDASEDQDDKRLLGLSISVQGLHSPDSAIEKVLKIAGNNSWRFQFRSAVELLNSIKFGSLREQTIISLTKAWHLTLLDRVAEAEHILKESVEILEELAEANPKENQIHLLDCFLNYGVLLHRIKQSVESEAKFERALQISRDIDPTIGMNFQYVIGVCWWYSSFLRDTHRLSKASALLRWALDLIQIEKVPSIVARNRALTLYKLGDVLYFGGKPDEAETACKDALDTETEDVIKLNSLRLLGDIYLRTSRPYEAKRMLEESLGLIREISKREKGVHQVQPTSQLRHYALALKLLGNYSEAEVHYKDALEVSRESVDDAAEVYLPVLSRVLNDFAILYYEMYQYSKAGEYYKEALENYEKLSRDWPEGFEKYVAWTLNNYSIVLRETGEVGKARKYYRKALDIGRDLARKYPESVSNSHLLGVVLNNLGILYRKANNNSQAEEALREAYEIRQTLAKTTPAYFLTTLTTTLNNLGVVLAVTNRLSDAQEIFLQALEHRRKLVEKSPEMHNHGLACILNNLGNINKLTDEHPKARKYYLEGREILEKLVLNTPSVYKRCLTIVLSNLLLLHDSTGETEKAENIKAKLREMGASEIPNKEVWIEEEDAEADAH
jgi:tetratricopeptide (TPR) repeat protein